MIELFTDCRHKNRDSDLSVSRLLNFFKTFVKSQCRTVLATSNWNYTTLKQRGGYDEISICTKYSV